jgi:sulfur relay (sulfurtransferase) complex TusBCD TusD component (DsrE family)
MKTIFMKSRFFLIQCLIFLVAVMISAPVLADKPNCNGGQNILVHLQTTDLPAAQIACKLSLLLQTEGCNTVMFLSSSGVQVANENAFPSGSPINNLLTNFLDKDGEIYLCPGSANVFNFSKDGGGTSLLTGANLFNSEEQVTEVFVNADKVVDF